MCKYSGTKIQNLRCEALGSILSTEKKKSETLLVPSILEEECATCHTNDKF
jgi:hypothetical protein